LTGVDVSHLGRIDTTGAFLLDRMAQSACVENQPLAIRGRHAQAASTLAAVSHYREPCPEDMVAQDAFLLMLTRLGKGIVTFWKETVDTFAFFGELVMACLRMIARPSRFRLRSAVAVMEEAGLDAVPIVAFLSFFIGLVIAFLGANLLTDFGASILTVELTAVAMMREFGVVITAIILAGRTDSAFTAQIGAMRMNEEIDAMRTFGMDPMEVLVVPRLVAMLVTLPILAFIATMSGILGGILVCWSQLGISPGAFIVRVSELVPSQHFFVGLVKAPFFAIIVALVGCRHGLLVEGSVTSLGQRTTASVVQAIFLVIAVDAIFAMIFLELDL